MRLYIKPYTGLLFALAFVLISITSCGPVESRRAQGMQKPNIVIILADDLGYAAGAFGQWHVGLGPLEIGFSENYIEPGNLEGNLYLDGYQVVNADPADPFKWIPTEFGKSVTNFRQGITR